MNELILADISKSLKEISTRLLGIELLLGRGSTKELGYEDDYDYAESAKSEAKAAFDRLTAKPLEEFQKLFGDLQGKGEI